MCLKSSCVVLTFSIVTLTFFDPNHENNTHLYALFLMIPATQHPNMLQQPPFSTFTSRFSLRNRQPRLSLISANRLESQSARLSTQSKPRTNQQFHGFGSIKNKQQFG